MDGEEEGREVEGRDEKVERVKEHTPLGQKREFLFNFPCFGSSSCSSHRVVNNAVVCFFPVIIIISIVKSIIIRIKRL